MTYALISLLLFWSFTLTAYCIALDEGVSSLRERVADLELKGEMNDEERGRR